MIILDTHVWVWWVHGDAHLPDQYYRYLEIHEAQGLGVSAISCWEVAKLVDDWLDQALAYPGVRWLDLTPRIIVESTQLPGTFHRDPADQLIVATARVYDCPLVTVDAKLLAYPHVQTQP